MDYTKQLPPFYMDISDFNALQIALNIVYNEVRTEVKQLLDDIVILKCSEERLSEWEEILGIPYQGRDITQRRMMILATLQGTGKLNEPKIKTIVRTFTGGGCLVSFANSKITVKISPPEWGELFLFPDVEKALRPLIPAHLDLEVIRYYNTWKNRKEQYGTWNDLMTGNANWAELRNKVEGI